MEQGKIWTTLNNGLTLSKVWTRENMDLTAIWTDSLNYGLWKNMDCIK